ncbi:MAG: ester cyclase [Bacteroidetes bacterium]|nr:ester cyclase [Bacteroidota bacterium]MDA0873707.1 ester cyclase [Bacteroidota bacterium]
MDRDRAETFGKTYAAAWSSKDPSSVADMFASNGSLVINDGPEAVGYDAVVVVAQEFMTAFPDLDVTCDCMAFEVEEWRWYWTMRGHYSGPGGTGRSIDISGYEVLEFDAEGRIVCAEGHFDQKEYDRQLGLH